MSDAAMAHKKLHLPEKQCASCGLPFSWRKKWAKVWNEVRYCSQRCRSQRNAISVGEHGQR